MATNNFYNHENGIFVIESSSIEDAYERYKEMQLDLGEEIEPMEDIEESLYYDMADYDEMILEDFYYNFDAGVMPHGMEGLKKDNGEIEIVNNKYKTIAILTIEPGYYDHAQVIIETDPEEIFGDYMPETQAELYEQYSPHHKRLLKYLERITTPIRKVGGFSNGEAIYELA